MNTKFSAARWFVVAGVIFLCTPCIADTCTVTRVHAGDLLEITCNDKQQWVRLAAIDAPELSTVKGLPGQPFSEKARLHLAETVRNQAISIKRHGATRSGRTLAVVFIQELNVNLAMIQAGLAEVFQGQPPESLDLTPYRQAEAEARRALLGIWVLRDQYFSPKDWREMYQVEPSSSQ